METGGVSGIKRSLIFFNVIIVFLYVNENDPLKRKNHSYRCEMGQMLDSLLSRGEDLPGIQEWPPSEVHPQQGGTSADFVTQVGWYLWWEQEERSLILLFLSEMGNRII